MKKFSYFFLLVLLTYPSISQNHYLDQLEDDLKETSDPAKKMTLLHQLVDSTSSTDLSLAKRFANEAIAIAAQSTKTNLLASANLLAGKTWIKLTSYDSAGMFLQAAQAGFEKLNDPAKMGEAIYYQGVIAANRKEFAKASEHYYKALEIWEKANHQKGIAQVFSGISDINYMQDDYEDAIENGNKAIAILEQLDEPMELARVHKEMAYNHLFRGEYDESMGHVNKALELSIAAKAKPLDLASIYNARGNILKNMDRYDEALKDYESNLALCKQAGSERGVMVSHANIGHALLLKQDYATALPHTLKAIEMMNASGDLRNLWENYIHASNIYVGLGDHENANRYTWLYADENERLYEEEIAQLKMELAQKYQSGQQGATIAIQQERINQQRIIQWLIGGIAALLALVLLMLYRFYRQKQQSNELLATANEQLEKKNAENELLLKEIHHRVKNNLQTISSLLNLQSAGITDASALEAVKESQSRVRSMALIHQKLYQGEKLVAVKMKDYFETMGEAMIESFGQKASNVSLEIPMEELELDVDTAIPLGLITNELLTNSLKYAFPGDRPGKIEISLTAEKNEELCLRIADNGVGLSGEKDSSIGPGTGFGGRLVNLLTMQLGGQMEQREEKGTATIIRFKPLAKAA